MITIYIKSLSGNIHELEVEEKTTISNLLNYLTNTYPKQYPPRITQLIRDGKDKEDFIDHNEMMFVFLHDEDPLQPILNRTEGTYFYGEGKYEKKLEPLFEKQKDGTSRWRRSDNIVFVPPWVPLEYIEKTYERIYI
jgi:hypothetical protein